MQVFHSVSELSVSSSGSAVAIGNFDGVHLGHQALLAGMVKQASAKSLTPSVLTFFPHPVEVLNPSIRLERLTTTSEKLVLLESLGVETALVEKFDTQLAALSAEDFLDQFLLRGLRARSIHVGFDFRFGKGRRGDVAMIRDFSSRHGIEFFVQEPFQHHGQKISSSLIRDQVRHGKVKEAAVLLGRPFRLTGAVVKGEGRGKGLGFPTANVSVPREKLLPGNGVYLTRANLQRQAYFSLTNIGVRPTFGIQDPERKVEAHLLNFNLQIYDESLELEFLDRVRDEKSFGSVSDLKAQIQKDVDWALQYTKIS